MSVLIAAVVLVGLICTLDLLLTIGVIKRLREHSSLLSSSGRFLASIAVGEEVGAFATSTVDGEPVSRELLTGQTLVGFFAPGCKPCQKRLPEFVAYARQMPGGRDRVLAIVVGDGDDAAAYVTDLSPVARVVEEDSSGALSTAFKAVAFPVVLLVAPNADGRLVVETDQVDLRRPAVTAA